MEPVTRRRQEGGGKGGISFRALGCRWIEIVHSFVNTQRELTCGKPQNKVLLSAV